MVVYFWKYGYISVFRERFHFFPTQVWDEMKTKTKDMILYSTHQSHFLRILVFGQSVVLSKSSFKCRVFRWKNAGNCIYQRQTALLRMRISAPHFRVCRKTLANIHEKPAAMTLLQVLRTVNHYILL